MTQYIKNKQLKIISDFDINNYRLLNVDTPIDSLDAVNKDFVDINAINYALSTGLYSGGTMEINSSTTFNLSAGIGYIVDPISKSISKITWSGQTNISIMSIGPTDITISIAIDSNGNIFQQIPKFSPQQRTNHIILGELFLHPITQDLSEVMFFPVLSRDLSSIVDGELVIGPRVKSGNNVSANGSNMFLNVTSGVIYGYSVNAGNSLNIPNFSEQSNINVISFFTTYFNGTEWVFSGGTNTVDPGYWSNGTSTLQTSIPSKYNLRILFRNAAHDDKFMLGYPTQTHQYNDIQEAESNLNALGVEYPSELFGLSVPLAWIIIRGDTSEMNDTDDVKFIPIQSVSTSAGSIATSASDVSYDPTSSYNLNTTNVQDTIEEINNTNFSYSNTDMMALSGISSGTYLATSTAVAETPVSLIRVTVNGLKVTVGNGTLINVDCYFSGDGGTTPRSYNNVLLGDYLYWIGPTAKYQLETTDSIDFIYMVRVVFV